MFVKKIIKGDKVYYLLTLCEKVEKGQGKGKDKDTKFVGYFIPDKLFEVLVKLGVPDITKENK